MGNFTRSLTDTAQKIVVAAFEMMRDAPATPFSHEAVAARASISARTVYRHFPKQDELLASVWRHVRDSTATRWPHTEKEILPFIEELFDQFDRNSALTRALVSVSPKTNISVHGSVEGRSAFRTALAQRCDGWSEEATNKLVATCLAIYSAPFWMMLRDRGQLAQPQAVAAAQAAMAAVLAAATEGV